MASPGPSLQQKTRALVSAMLLNLIIGNYYAYGNINGYIANYLISKGNQISTKDPLIVQPVWLVIQSIVTAFSLTVATKIGYRWTNFVAFMIIAIGNVIC